jgi:histidinol-phosphatase (PHP family)
VIVDYHMHLRAPDESIDHSVDSIERYVEVAAERGIDEIGFTEHVYYFVQTRSLWDVDYHRERCTHDLDRYVEAVTEAKRQGMPVRLGLEVDYVPGREDETREILAPYPWDYLLGSIHYLDGLSLDIEPGLVHELGPAVAWERYFAALESAGRSGLFDSLAHPDLVKFFGHEVEWDHEPFVAALNGTCLEVSSAGLHKPHGRMYPEGRLLASARRSGVGITLASDAHVPQNVGRDLDKAVEHARGAGYDTITVFDRRRRRQEPLG